MRSAVHGQPSYSVCQRFWCAAFNTEYAALAGVALRVALAMVICHAPAVPNFVSLTRDSDGGREKEAERKTQRKRKTS